jgi:outer membrane protein assembly factor BamB
LKLPSSFLFSALFIAFFVSCAQIDTTLKKLNVSAPEKSQKSSLFFPLWFKNLDPSYQTGNLPIATNWPLVDTGILYVGDNRGYMVAYELENGREIWRQFDGGTYHAAPSIYKDQIIYGTTEGRVVSRHKLNGAIKYVVDVGSGVETPAAIFKGQAFFHLRDHKIVNVDVETGKVLWAYKRSVPYLTTVQRASTPLIFNNKMFVGFADGYFCAFRVEDGVLLWEKKLSEGTKFVDVDLSPVLLGEDILVGSLAGPLHLLNSQTGATIRRFDFIVSRAPHLVADKILLGTTNGEFIILGKDFNQVVSLKVSDLPISSMKEWKNYYVVSTVARTLFLIDKKTFKVSESFDLGHVSSAVFGDMQVGEGKLAFLSSRNRLYVFR